MTLKTGASKDARTYNETWMTSGSFSMLTSSKVFIGGSKEPFRLPGSSSKNNFVGCLRNVRIKDINYISTFFCLYSLVTINFTATN